MWFWLALIALLCWSGSDLFSKIGCRGNDKYAHLKMVIAVGIIMGIHALYEIFVGGVEVTWHVILTYLPVSLLYISSMTLGYIGLRYIELSISSPICNSSGALVAVLCFITGTLDDGIEGSMRLAVMGAVALVCIAVIWSVNFTDTLCLDHWSLESLGRNHCAHTNAASYRNGQSHGL